MEPDPLHKATDERNMTRKLEEYAQGKYKTAAGRNARRIASWVILHSDLLAGVTGLWELVKNADDEPGDGELLYRRFNTALDEQEDQEGLERTWTRRDESKLGLDHIALVQFRAQEVIQGPYGLQLIDVHGLHAELRTGGRRAFQEDGRK